MVIYTKKNLCFGAKTISQGIILTLKVKVPCLSVITSSVTKFVRCAIYHRKMDAVGHS